MVPKALAARQDAPGLSCSQAAVVTCPLQIVAGTSGHGENCKGYNCRGLSKLASCIWLYGRVIKKGKLGSIRELNFLKTVVSLSILIAGFVEFDGRV